MTIRRATFKWTLLLLPLIVIFLVVSRTMHHHRNKQLWPAVLAGKTEVVREMLRKGAVADQRDAWNATPLIVATELGHAQIVKALLEHGAAPEARASHGDTALIRAARTGRLRAAEALVGGGADMDARAAGDGYTPLLAAIDQAGFMSFGNEQGGRDVARLLLRSGANPHLRSREGCTALWTAALRGQWPMVELLIKAGADINAVNGRGLSPLGAALIFPNDLRTVTGLVRHGANLDAPIVWSSGSAGQEAMRAAFRHGDRNLVNLLSSKGVQEMRPTSGVRWLDTALERRGATFPLADWMRLRNGPPDPRKRGDLPPGTAHLTPRPPSLGGKGESPLGPVFCQPGEIAPPPLAGD